MANTMQPVSVNGIEFDALIDFDESYDAQVPEYPTERGFSVSDTIVIQPEVLNLNLFVTDTPVTWLQRHGAGFGRTNEIINQVKELFFQKLPVVVIMTDATYTDMAITSLSIRKSSEIGYAAEIAISLKKITVTETATVTIPDTYGRSGVTAAQNGTANSTWAQASGKSSSSSGGGGSGGSSGGSSYGSLSPSSTPTAQDIVDSWLGGASLDGGGSGGGGGGSSSSDGSNGSVLWNAANQFGLV